MTAKALMVTTICIICIPRTMYASEQQDSSKTVISADTNILPPLIKLKLNLFGGITSIKNIIPIRSEGSMSFTFLQIQPLEKLIVRLGINIHYSNGFGNILLFQISETSSIGIGLQYGYNPFGNIYEFNPVWATTMAHRF